MNAVVSKRRRVAVVFNPTAGGAKRSRLNAVIDALRDDGCEVRTYQTEGPDHASALARQAAHDGADVVAIAGGDGTINEAVNGAAGTGVPLAIVPIGTANVLALEIGMPKDPEAIARTISRGEARRVSAGRANGRLFLLMVGAGFDAHVVAGVGAGRMKKILGKFAYVLETFKTLARFPFRPYRLWIDGNEVEASSAVISGARYYGGPFSCTPDARLEDPELHVCLFEKPGWFWTLRYAAALVMGRLHETPGVKLIKARKVKIKGAEGEPVQGDGEVLTALPLKVEAGAAALDLVFPRATTA